MKTLKSYPGLCRVPIALFACCSATTGFLIAPFRNTSDIIGPLSALFLLACGTSALNQYQERHIDALMERTKHRPIPSGAVPPQSALIFAITLIISGLSVLVLGYGAILFGLGLAAVLWYNGVYAFLKKKTAFAVVPGSLVGTIPPAIGFLAGGGALADSRLLALVMLFMIWQIPHFWLVLLRSGDDYERAGLPSLTRIIPKEQLIRITVMWIVASALTSLGMPLFGIVHSPFIYFSLVPAAIWHVGNGARLLVLNKTPGVCLSTFRSTNAYILLVMVLLTLDSVLCGS